MAETGDDGRAAIVWYQTTAEHPDQFGVGTAREDAGVLLAPPSGTDDGDSHARVPALGKTCRVSTVARACRAISV